MLSIATIMTLLPRNSITVLFVLLLTLSCCHLLVGVKAQSKDGNEGAAAAAAAANIVSRGSTPTNPAHGAPKWFTSLFSELDLNHDGLLDINEYTSGRVSIQQAMEANKSRSWAMTSSWMNLRGFWKSFTSAMAMIFATEIGDKTFFIAAVLSMKYDRGAVFGGAIFALVVMTILSTALGLVLPQFVSRQYTHLLGGVLFLYFGIKMYMESRNMEAGRASDELEEVEEELLQQNRKKDEDDDDDVESGVTTSPKQQKRQKARHTRWLSVAWQAMTLIFVAEWGDRSQIATIALGAAKNPLGVCVGGSLGHMVCTGLAVLGGRMLAARISEKTVNQWGGVIFLIFGLHSIFLEE